MATDRRHVAVPPHEELSIGTLRSVADDAGARDVHAFREWIDRNS